MDCLVCLVSILTQSFSKYNDEQTSKKPGKTKHWEVMVRLVCLHAFPGEGGILPQCATYSCAKL